MRDIKTFIVKCLKSGQVRRIINLLVVTSTYFVNSMSIFVIQSRFIQLTKHHFRKMSSGTPVHDMIKPLSWLLGKWQGTGKGSYPTMEDFKYEETVEFFHVGQPNIQFSFYSSDPISKQPIHREVGFIRVEPGNTGRLAFVIAQNLGYAEMEEGHFVEQEINTETHTIGRLSFGKRPATTKVSRIFRRKGDELEQICFMETEKTPLTQHKRITYSKVE